MAGFERLLDAWQAGKQQRTDLTPGERCASIENDLGAPMSSARRAVWLLLGQRQIDRGDEERERG